MREKTKTPGWSVKKKKNWTLINYWITVKTGAPNERDLTNEGLIYITDKIDGNFIIIFN